MEKRDREDHEGQPLKLHISQSDNLVPITHIWKEVANDRTEWSFENSHRQEQRKTKKWSVLQNIYEMPILQNDKNTHNDTDSPWEKQITYSPSVAIYEGSTFFYKQPTSNPALLCD